MTIWKNEIKIKEFMSNDKSDKAILELCNKLIPQLKCILLEEKKEGYFDEDFIKKLEEKIYNFIFIKHNIEHNENTKCVYSIKTWCEIFNDALNELYDLADTIVIKRDLGGDVKFLWIG